MFGYFSKILLISFDVVISSMKSNKTEYKLCYFLVNVKNTHHAYFVINNLVQTYKSFDLLKKSQVMVKYQSIC